MCSPSGLRLHPLRRSRWGRRRSGQTLELRLARVIVSQALATGGQRWVQTFWVGGVGRGLFVIGLNWRMDLGRLVSCLLAQDIFSASEGIKRV